MPYKKISELPPPVKDNLPTDAQDIFLAAYNSAYEQHGKEKDAEITCNSIAWAAVKNKYKKDPKGNWVAKEANMKTQEAAYPWDQCIADQMARYGDEETAKKVCGKIKALYGSVPRAEIGKYLSNIEEKLGIKAKEANMADKSSDENLESLQTVYSNIIQEAGKRNAAADAGRLKKIIEMCQELLSDEFDITVNPKKITEALTEANAVLVWLKEQAIMKTEDGVKFPAEAYAYVPCKEESSEWKLRLWEDPTKKITRMQLGKAAAALSPGGFRGQKVVIPSADLTEVKRTIRSEYKNLDVKDEDIPKWVKEVEKREELTSYVPLSEAKLDKGIATVTIIKSGFNEGNGRYYPAEVLKRDYKVFEGAKMYADHPTPAEDKARPERSIRDWVGTLNNVEVKEDGTIIGKATIVEPWLQAKLARLRDSEMLSEMGISINAIGSASDAEIEGIKTKLVEKLIKARSVDFVTEPGAGGSVEFYESERINIDLIEINQLKELRPDLVEVIKTETRTELTREVKRTMEMEEKVKELEGQITTLTTERDELKTKMEEAARAQKKAEAKSLIDEAVGKSELPEAAKSKILEKFKDVETADGIEEAIKSEKDYIASIQESGKVKGLGKTEVNVVENHKALVESFKKLGLSDKEAETAAEGR